jgi:hypothetical protein
LPARLRGATIDPVDEPVIHREEVVALLFNVSHIVALLTSIVEDGDGEEDES